MMNAIISNLTVLSLVWTVNGETTALSAEEALALDIKDMDLVILDIMMGELSGFGLARILKRRSETSDIPIIFCSALDTADDKVKGLDIGADDYITKPYSIAEVLARVRSVLRRSTWLDVPHTILDGMLMI